MNVSLAGGGTVRIDFTAPAGTEIDIDTTCAYCPWGFLATTTATPYFHTGLAAGSTQCWRLLARDPVSRLQSGYSNWACLVIS